MIQIIHQDSSAARYGYQLSGLTKQELRQDFSHLWEKLIDHVAAHRDHGTWNRLLFECWVEDGYVLAYPQLRGESPDKRYPEVTVGLDYLASVIEKSGDAIRDERIEGLFNIAYMDVQDAIRGSYRREPGKSAIRRALADNDFKCFTMRDNDTDTLMEFEIFF